MFVITVEWSKEALIEAWMADPVAACEKAGVTLPESEFILHQRKGLEGTIQESKDLD